MCWPFIINLCYWNTSFSLIRFAWCFVCPFIGILRVKKMTATTCNQIELYPTKQGKGFCNQTIHPNSYDTQLICNNWQMNKQQNSCLVTLLCRYRATTRDDKICNQLAVLLVKLIIWSNISWNWLLQNPRWHRENDREELPYF